MDPLDLIPKLLRILFYVFVLVAIGGYCADRWFDLPNTLWIWSGVGAIGCSLIRFFLRFM